MACTCRGYGFHKYDQGGYETCSCNTCNDPRCRQEISDYRRSQREQEEKDYRTYQELRSRFGDR